MSMEDYDASPSVGHSVKASKPGVHFALKKQRETLEQLQVSISVLEEALKLVLRPTEEADRMSPDVNPSPPRSELLNIVEGNNQVLDHLTRQVRLMTDRLEC